MLRRILRFAIVLLGLQLTAAQVIDVGATGIGIIAVTLAATFVFTIWLGRVLGVDRKLTELIAAGTSICGASAIIATNTVTRARGEDAAYALACVTVFGSIAMFVYPMLGSLCTSVRTPTACGLAPRSTRSRRSLPPPSRADRKPARSAPSPSSRASSFWRHSS